MFWQVNVCGVGIGFVVEWGVFLYVVVYVCDVDVDYEVVFWCGLNVNGVVEIFGVVFVYCEDVEFVQVELVYQCFFGNFVRNGVCLFLYVVWEFVMQIEFDDDGFGFGFGVVFGVEYVYDLIEDFVFVGMFGLEEFGNDVGVGFEFFQIFGQQ